MQVVLVRHTAVDVPAGMCYGQTDVPLRTTFEQEAAEVKKHLPSSSYQAVYTSPLTRCVRLATYCGYGDALRDDRLKEMYFGRWEWHLLDEQDPVEFEHWLSDPLHVPAPGGESIMMMKDRLLHFLQERYAAGERELLVFAHGGIILAAEILLGKKIAGDPYAHLHPYGAVVPLDFTKLLEGPNQG